MSPNYTFKPGAKLKVRYRVQLVRPLRSDVGWEIIKEQCGDNTVGGYHCEDVGVIMQGWYPDILKYIKNNLESEEVVATCYYAD